MLHGTSAGVRRGIAPVTRRAVLSGAAAVLATRPRLAQAQRRGRDQRLVVLAGGGSSHVTLGQTLGELGSLGDRLRFEAVPVLNEVEARAALAIGHDVLLANGQLHVQLLQRLTKTIPIVFNDTSDPVGAG